MYIKDRKKVEKALANLVIEMARQDLIEADKKSVLSNFRNARGYEIEELLEKVAADYESRIDKEKWGI